MKKKTAKSIFVLYILLLFTFLACAKKSNIEETNIENKNITSEIKILEEKIIQNITGNYDIDNEIDIDRIKALMDVYEPQTNSCIVKIDDAPYDLLIIGDLLKTYNNIRVNWNNTRKEQIQKLTTEYINAKIEKKETDIYALSNTIIYYSYQAEMAEVFFPYLLEQFQLSNAEYDLSELPEIIIQIEPLLITAINIDDIPYDAIAVETLQTQMMQIAENDMGKICVELMNELNIQFNQCINNVDSYLDWYYGFGTGFSKLWEMIKGAVDRNRTFVGAMQEFMVKNYMEKIGYNVRFENVLTILEKGRKETIERAIIFGSVLEDCILDFDAYTLVVNDITGDDFMSSYILFPDYLNKVISEGLPIIGMGNILEHDGIPVLDGISAAVAFIPAVGFIEGILLDYVTLKITEIAKRPEFKEQIISSIRDDEKRILDIIILDKYKRKDYNNEDIYK